MFTKQSAAGVAMVPIGTLFVNKIKRRQKIDARQRLYYVYKKRVLDDARAIKLFTKESLT